MEKGDLMDAVAVDKLKQSVINQFDQLIKAYSKGNDYSYCNILNSINFLQMYESLDSPRRYYEFLMNYEQMGVH